MSINLNKVKKIYFLGIKGVAMSGLAVICKEKGIEVCGSDVSEKFITDKILEKNKIKIFENFSSENLNFNPDLAVIGASWGKDNVEFKEIEKRKIPVLTDSELRGLLSREKETIVITGVHGKTTTTGLMAYVFNKANLKPSFLIGTGNVFDLNSNASWNNIGKHFIVEGDEYAKSKTDKNPKFLDLEAATSVITSLEWEHVDIYKNIDEMKKPFRKLIEKTKDMSVTCGDWESIREIIAGFEKKVITYGFGKNNFWQAYDVSQQLKKTLFKVKKGEVELGEFELRLRGEHNVLNALAVIIVGLSEGIRLQKIKDSLKSFRGSERRFDVSSKGGIIFIDDYAHHPTEIKATLKSIRQCYPKSKVWCIFQPHMASRTKALFEDFSNSFGSADKVIFADIFASAREGICDVTSKDLAEKTKSYHNDVVYVGDLNETLNYVKDKIKPGIILVTMGAGDVYRVRDKLVF